MAKMQWEKRQKEGYIPRPEYILVPKKYSFSEADKAVFTFGKYRFKLISKVIETDPSYIKWVFTTKNDYEKSMIVFLSKKAE